MNRPSTPARIPRSDLARRWRASLGALATAAMLAACGGGGGGDAGQAPGTPVAQAPRVELTDANATRVTAEAISAAGVGDIGGAVLPLFGVQVQADAGRPPAALPALVAAARRALTLQAPSLATGITTTSTFACSSGSIGATITEARSDRPSPGDRFELVFNACVEGGERLDGSLSMGLSGVNAALNVFTIDVQTTAFTVTANGSSERLDGRLQLVIDGSSPAQTTVRATSPAITLTRAVGGQVRSARSVIGFGYDGTIVNATGRTTESYSFTGSGDFSALGQVSFVVATVSPFVTDSRSALRPGSGSARVTGANGRSVLVTVLPTGVRLDLDVAGDSGIDRTVVLTWAEFDAVLGN